MTTSAQVTCPDCGQHWHLSGGVFPFHKALGGGDCRMSGRSPDQHETLETQAAKFLAVEPLQPPLPSVTTVAHGPTAPEPVGTSPTPSPTLVKPRAGARKPRSDKGSKRQADADADADAKAAKPKRTRRSYFVVVEGMVAPFSSLEAALAAMGAATVEWELERKRYPDAIETTPPALIQGRLLTTKTVSIPASTVTKVVRHVV